MQTTLTINLVEDTDPAQIAADAYQALLDEGHQVSATAYASNSAEFSQQNNEIKITGKDILADYVSNVTRWRRYPYLHILLETY